VRNCIFEYVVNGVASSDDSVIEWCDISFPGFDEIRVELSAGLTKPKNVMFPLVKKLPIEGGIALSNPSMDPPVAKRCEIRYCHIHELFDGDKLGRYDDSESHHNVYSDCYDNAVEIEHGVKGQQSRNLRFHHNLLVGHFHGAISHQQQVRDTIVGPHYVYRNVIVCEGGNWVPWVAAKTSLAPETVGVYYYHNLIWMKDTKAYLFWVDGNEPHEKRKRALHSLYMRNNILMFPDWVTGKNAPATTDHNLLVAPRPKKQWVEPGGKQFASIAELGLVDPAANDFRLKSDSPAVDAGAKIPGFNDGYAGAAPDIGPFELGEEPGADWPRPRRLIFSPDARD
jgi:hypothetical protein